MNSGKYWRGASWEEGGRVPREEGVGFYPPFLWITYCGRALLSSLMTCNSKMCDTLCVVLLQRRVSCFVYCLEEGQKGAIH